MINVPKYNALLGLRVKDKVTGFKGVCTSVSYDLYGCVQVIINPGCDKEGKLGEGAWFDVNRVDLLDSTAVMIAPDFDYEEEELEFEPEPHGPECKPERKF